MKNIILLIIVFIQITVGHLFKLIAQEQKQNMAPMIKKRVDYKKPLDSTKVKQKNSTLYLRNKILYSGNLNNLNVSLDTSQIDSISILKDKNNTEMKTRAAYGVILEDEFPWPPPQPSASGIIYISDLFQKRVEILGQISDRLVKLLQEAGYERRSFFSIPKGFALVTYIEQINDDGTPKNPGRWSTRIKLMEKFSLGEYFKLLFLNSKEGLFRMVVFLVTPAPFNQLQEKLTLDQAMKLYCRGMSQLNDSIAHFKYTDDCSINAYIYEFLKPESGEAMLTESPLDCKTHLIKSGIMKNIY
jgi:uncharacterized protein YxeA